MNSPAAIAGYISDEIHVDGGNGSHTVNGAAAVARRVAGERSARHVKYAVPT